MKAFTIGLFINVTLLWGLVIYGIVDFNRYVVIIKGELYSSVKKQQELAKDLTETMKEVDLLSVKIKDLQHAVNELQEKKCKCSSGCCGSKCKRIVIDGVEVESLLQVSRVCGGNLYLEWNGKDGKCYNKIVTTEQFNDLVFGRK